MHYLIRYAEIGKEPHPEKSKSERDIVSNIKSKIKGTKINKDIGRLFLETKKDAAEILKQIHGISTFSPCLKCSLQDLDKNLVSFAEKRLKRKSSFGVKVKRVGEHPFSSQEKARKLGEKILNIFPQLKVDLKMPDEMIFVEIRNNDCYIFDLVVPGIDQLSPYKKTAIHEPKFIVDDMLGKLAVRLRMLGFDATFYGDSADSFLLRKSREEDRTILTRDEGLIKVRGANAFFVPGTKLTDQVREVIERFGLKVLPENMFSRCSVCNEPLRDLRKEEVKGKVPPAVYKLFDEFAYCNKCDKYYWKGTHYEKIIEELKGIIPPSSK